MVDEQLTRAEAEAFLYRETRLIDERRLEEWLELFAPDGRYWLPLVDDADPEWEPSVIYDDRLQLEKRVYQLVHQRHLGQSPASRTVHLVSNVEVEPGTPAGEALVHCSQLVCELRPGDHQALQRGLGAQRILAARCQYRLRYVDEVWRIALKKVLLIDRDLPLSNLTFII